jgi:hypothetical protein
MATVEEEEKSAHTGNRTLICPSSNISITDIQLSQLIKSFIVSIAKGNTELKNMFILFVRVCFFAVIFRLLFPPFLSLIFSPLCFFFGPYCELDEYSHITISEFLCVIY